MLHAVGEGRRIHFNDAFWAMNIGYMANLALPRSGEFVRCLVLKRKKGVSFSFSLGTAFSERILDLISLVGCIFLAFFMELSLGGKALLSQNLVRLGEELQSIFHAYGFVIVLVLVLVLGVSYLFFRRIRGKKDRPWVHVLQKIWTGLMVFCSAKQLPVYALLTVSLWFFYYATAYSIMQSHALSAALPFQVAMVLLTTSAISTLVPIQGSIGVFHGVVIYTLHWYGLDVNIGTTLALIWHFMQLFLFIVMGIWGWAFFSWRLGRNRSIV